MIRNYALLITLPLTIILYMLFYFVPEVSARGHYWTTIHWPPTVTAMGWRLSSARVFHRSHHHRARGWVYRAEQISASHCWTRTRHSQRRGAILVVILKTNFLFVESMYKWMRPISASPDRCAEWALVRDVVLPRTRAPMSRRHFYHAADTLICI